MGSGISLNKQQMLIIIQRELDNQYANTIHSIRSYTDEGYQIYETFDHEQEYNNRIKFLENELIKILN